MQSTTIAQKRVIYLQLYVEGQKALEASNPCNQHLLPNGKMGCLHYPKGKDGLCCSGCKYLDPTGCTTQSLGCKLGWCSSGLEQPHELNKGPGFYPPSTYLHPTAQRFAELRDQAVEAGIFHDNYPGSGFRMSLEDMEAMWKRQEEWVKVAQ